MSHHYSGADFGFPHGDARLDFTDLYAFPKPGDAGKSIRIMNAHPSVGVNPPGPTTALAFAPEAIYELKIDTNGDAVADIAYRVRFTSSEGGAQTATLRRVEGAQAAGTGDDGDVVIEAAGSDTGIARCAELAKPGSAAGCLLIVVYVGPAACAGPAYTAVVSTAVPVIVAAPRPAAAIRSLNLKVCFLLSSYVAICTL